MKLRFHNPFDLVVPEAGLEPAQVAPHAPETCASTNSAIPVICSFLVSGTEGGTRTHTMLPSLDFESSASTSSATSAFILLFDSLCFQSGCKYISNFGIWKPRLDFFLTFFSALFPSYICGANLAKFSRIRNRYRFLR